MEASKRWAEEDKENTNRYAALKVEGQETDQCEVKEEHKREN